MKLIAACCLGFFALSACTWVNENPAGQSVIIVSKERVKNCENKGKISVQVKDQVAFYRRSAKKVLKELQTLARNEAIKLNADTIVAIGEPVEGRQTYQAYRCL